MAKDLISLEFNYSVSQFRLLSEMITAADVQTLAERMDRIMFGTKGSLAKSIKAGGREGEKWQELKPEYLAWKERMKKSGTKIRGESPPNKVISTKIWIRTGKVLDFVQTLGDGAHKRIRVFPDNLLKGKVFYEAYIKKASYWEHAHERRKLFFFTKEDEEKLVSILKSWAVGIINRSIKHAAAA